MKYYILKNKEVSWGDYGDALCYGYLNTMDDNFELIDYPELERTGPYVPELYKANSVDLLLIESLKKLLEHHNIKGVEKYVKVVKKKIVKINWEKWDSNSSDPEFYPDSGEPEDYIYEGIHNEEIAKKMPEIYYAEITNTQNTLVKIDNAIDDEKYTSYKFVENTELDIFIPLNVLFIVVSEKFKNIIEKANIDTVRFLQLHEN